MLERKRKRSSNAQGTEMYLCGLSRFEMNAAVVGTLYEMLRQQWWFQHESFEPCVSIGSFFLFMPMFWRLDMNPGFAKRWRIMRSDDMSTWRDVLSISFELVMYLAPILAFDNVVKRRSLPDEGPSAARVFCEIFGGIAVYDMLFFVAHYAMHMSSTLWKLHAKHHKHKAVRARDTARLGGIEELIDFSCSIMALNIINAHPLSRALYNITIVYLLHELHSNYSFPWALENIVPFGIIKGARAHTVHHFSGTSYFQKFLGPLSYLELLGKPQQFSFGSHVHSN